MVPRAAAERRVRSSGPPHPCFGPVSNLIRWLLSICEALTARTLAAWIDAFCGGPNCFPGLGALGCSHRSPSHCLCSATRHDWTGRSTCSRPGHEHSIAGCGGSFVRAVPSRGAHAARGRTRAVGTLSVPWSRPAVAAQRSADGFTAASTASATPPSALFPSSLSSETSSSLHVPATARHTSVELGAYHRGLLPRWLSACPSPPTLYPGWGPAALEPE